VGDGAHACALAATKYQSFDFYTLTTQLAHA